MGDIITYIMRCREREIDCRKSGFCPDTRCRQQDQVIQALDSLDPSGMHAYLEGFGPQVLAQCVKRPELEVYLAQVWDEFIREQG